MVARAGGCRRARCRASSTARRVVSAEKRAAVDEAIATLGFVPNPVARGLAGGRTLSIGVVTQAIDSPFYGAALRGIEEALGDRRLQPPVRQRPLDTRRGGALHRGAALAPGGRHHRAHRALSDTALRSVARSLPVVVTGRSAEGARAVRAGLRQPFEGARLATQHLLDLGHRASPSSAGDPDHPDAVERLRGYSRRWRPPASPDPALVLPGDFTRHSGLLAVERLLDSAHAVQRRLCRQRPDGLRRRAGLHRRGKQVPHDVSLVGFDDLAGALYTGAAADHRAPPDPTRSASWPPRPCCSCWPAKRRACAERARSCREQPRLR
jgi:LacI family transcriptional regulator